MSRAIFVLSIPRSGSSCVAGCLHRLGVDMGSANYMQNTDFLNPGGYYEDRRFQNITKQIAGQKYTVRYRAPTEDQLDAYWELVMQRCKNYPIWGVKGPRMAYTFHYIWPMLDDVRVVHVERDWESNVSSMKRHSELAYNGFLKMDRERAEALLVRWNEAVENRIAAFPGPVHSICYDQLFVEPVDTLLELHDFCFSGIEHLSKRIVAPAMTWLNEGYRHYVRDLSNTGQKDGDKAGASQLVKSWTKKRPCRCRGRE